MKINNEYNKDGKVNIKNIFEILLIIYLLFFLKDYVLKDNLLKILNIKLNSQVFQNLILSEYSENKLNKNIANSSKSEQDTNRLFFYPCTFTNIDFHRKTYSILAIVAISSIFVVMISLVIAKSIYNKCRKRNLIIAKV